MLFAMAALLIAATLLPQDPPWIEPAQPQERIGSFYGYLGIAIFGVVLVEWLHRRTPKNRWWGVKPLAIGLSGMFAFDLVIFSQAVLFRHIDDEMWTVRGIANAVAIFFVAVATKRNKAWTLDLHISRDAAFQSTALLAAGLYLLLVAAAAYWVHYFGGEWGRTLRIGFVFVALLAMATLVLSGSLRSRLKLFVSKNLFSYRYDYRVEWLRFTNLLGTSEHGENTYQQIVRAHADLVESSGGSIWLARGDYFCEIAQLNFATTKEQIASSSALISFLQNTERVVLVDEFADTPENYPALRLPDWLTALKHAWLIVPLISGKELLGFVIIGRPRAPVEVNWEVLELLDTASRQAASYLAQSLAKEALVETEKFDAFNRMSAFVVHDLKNLVAQLALLPKNAVRHGHDPVFQQDMLETIEHVVGRMNELMLQLRTGTNPVEKPHVVALAALIPRLIAAKRLHKAGIEIEIEEHLRVLAHADRIERVIGHIIQNAIEAADQTSAQVTVKASVQNRFAVVEIADNGIGMTEQFIREQLFHPFQTSKPHGMGIGMYESAQYVRSLGGRIEVRSELKKGTRFTLFLPLHETAENQKIGEPA
jgi:putative PEP-CTERM system histidine kinase